MIELALLRTRPFDAVRTTGFIIRTSSDDRSQSGRCNVNCIPMFNNNSIVTLDIRLRDEGKDWYCGVKKNGIGSVLVPFGQPDGSLILTAPMNGCALEVRREQEGNRVYHDYNGTSMPQSVDGTRMLRIIADHYMDRHDRHFDRIKKEFDRIGFNRKHTPCGFSFAHTIICVKRGDYWHFYNNVVSSTYELSLYSGQKLNHEYYQAKDYIKYELGSFPE